MFRKSFISFILAGVVIFVGGTATWSQTMVVAGVVELTKADGTKQPLEGAMVEVFRTDIKAGFPSTKTNRKGEFSFAGVPYVGTWIFSVSGPGAAPMVQPMPRGGGDRIVITLGPGDGKRLTEDEARNYSSSAAPSSTGKPSAEQEKAQAEYEAKKKEIEEKNTKATKANEVINRVFKEGNDALNAKNYDVAIARYDEGIAADPDFVGTAPILGNNRSTALRNRAVDSYNKAVKSTDVQEKVAGLTKAKQDLAASAQGYLRSFNVLKNAPVAEITDRANYDVTMKTTLVGSMETFTIAVKTEQVEQGVIEAAKVLIPAYSLDESDAAKKAVAQLTLADLYRVSENREEAVANYKKVLESSPDNIDALAYVGIVLVDLGWLKNNDKALSQEGANYLQKFVSVAPDTHRLKSGAVEYLNILKAQSIVPVKTTPTKKRN